MKIFFYIFELRLMSSNSDDRVADDDHEEDGGEFRIDI